MEIDIWRLFSIPWIAFMAEQITTAEISLSKTKEAVIVEAKRIEENCLYSSKGHLVAAAFWTNFNYWIGIPIAILAALGGILSFSKYSCFSGPLAIVVAISTAVSTFLNPKDKYNSHFMAGNNYESLLSKARIFWSIDCKREDSDEILTSKLKELSQHGERLNRDCPQIPKWAYKRAKAGIEAGEASYDVDKNKDAENARPLVAKTKLE